MTRPRAGPTAQRIRVAGLGGDSGESCDAGRGRPVSRHDAEALRPGPARLAGRSIAEGR